MSARLWTKRPVTRLTKWMPTACRKGEGEGRPMQFGVSVLLIIHALLAVLLLGGITHQAIAAGWPVAKRGQGFFNSLRGVNGMSYANAMANTAARRSAFVMTRIPGCC